MIVPADWMRLRIHCSECRIGRHHTLESTQAEKPADAVLGAPLEIELHAREYVPPEWVVVRVEVDEWIAGKVGQQWRLLVEDVVDADSELESVAHGVRRVGRKGVVNREAAEQLGEVLSDVAEHLRFMQADGVRATISLKALAAVPGLIEEALRDPALEPLRADGGLDSVRARARLARRE